MAVRSQDTLEETARRGDEIYERDIKPTLAEDQRGRYVAIDVDSGNWAIADTLRAATDEIHAHHPDPSAVWCLRVGYRVLRHFGGRPFPPEG